MSEQQKIFASLSGAFVAHLLLLFLVFLLLSTKAASSSLRGEGRLERIPPKEVTILMSELMEHITTEVPKPEARPFLSTDLNRPESQAPEKARFESDRNTTAASELRPDETLPGERVPTLNGDSPLPHLTLQNREFVEGRVDELPMVAAAAATPAEGGSAGGQPALSADSLREQQKAIDSMDSPPDAPVQTSEERENLEGARDLPKETLDERKSRSEGLKDRDAVPDERAEEAGEDTGSSVQRSFVDPADEGLFSSGFSPEERQNVINGSLARVGQNAVDAEETALGRYKKAVRDEISSTWHRYRQKNGDFVTWGILKLEFTVDRSGEVKNLQITKNEANAILAEFSLRAIKDAELPPMPDDVAKSVGTEGLVIQYDIIIY